MITNKTKTVEDIRRIQELRRSNAATSFRNKKKYNRKNKEWKKEI